jgi:MHS family proline/betaine transporter-like MFS transporter
VPFLAGLLVGLVGLAVRRHLPEPAAQVRADTPAAKTPLWDAFRAEWRVILRLVGINAFLAAGFYFAFVFAVTYLKEDVHISAARAFDINTASMLVLLAVIPLAGLLSDFVGRKPLLFLGAAGGLLLSWPLLWLMHHTETVAILAGQMGFALLIGLFGGVVPVTMAEALPTRVRCTAVSIAYNLCVGILGGCTPLVASYLIERSHNDLSPAYLLIAAAALSLVAVISLRETAWASLRTGAHGAAE